MIKKLICCPLCVNVKTEPTNFHQHWKTHFFDSAVGQDSAPVNCKICNKIELYDQVIAHYNKSMFTLSYKDLKQSVEEKNWKFTSIFV